MLLFKCLCLHKIMKGGKNMGIGYGRGQDNKHKFWANATFIIGTILGVIYLSLK